MARTLFSTVTRSKLLVDIFNDDSMTMCLSNAFELQDDDDKLITLSHPIEYFGRTNEQFDESPRSTFQGREYLYYMIWAMNR